MQYRLDRADVVVAIDADFLCDGPAGLRYARDFATRRRPEQADRMNRLYVLETMPTSTGSRADHRLALRPSEIAAAAAQLASAVVNPASVANRLDPRTDKWVTAIAKDLRAHRGASVVMAGEGQAPLVHAVVHQMNAALGNIGRTVTYNDPVEAEPVDQL